MVHRFSAFLTGLLVVSGRLAYGPPFLTWLIIATLAGNQSTATAQGGTAPKSFNVGYRVVDLPYQEDGRATTLTVAVWYPTAERPARHIYGGPTAGDVAVDAAPLAESGPYPLLVFSHGYGGSGLGAAFFTERLAAHGWLVAAPDHHDRHSAVRIRSGQVKTFDRRGLLEHAREIAASHPEDRDKYSYRLAELRLVIDRLPVSESFGNLVDAKRIAIGGHSLGGYGALGLCGPIAEYRDPRIKAVLLFSTGGGGYLLRAAELAAVHMPSMLFLGEGERSQRRGDIAMAELANRIYTNLPAPKYFLEVGGANHFSFNNRFTNNLGARLMSGSEEQFDVIRQYSIAFLEKYVAERATSAGVLDRKDPRLTRYISKTSNGSEGLREEARPVELQ